MWSSLRRAPRADIPFGTHAFSPVTLSPISMDADHLRRQGHAGWRMQRCAHPRTTLSSGLDRDLLHFIPDKSRCEAAADGRRSEPCRRFRFEHAHPAYHRSQGGTVSSALRQGVDYPLRSY